MNLSNRQAHDIALFLRQFERIENIKIDANPETTRWLRIESRHPKYNKK
jgi:hypothetical protein